MKAVVYIPKNDNSMEIWTQLYREERERRVLNKVRKLFEKHGMDIKLIRSKGSLTYVMEAEM